MRLGAFVNKKRARLEGKQFLSIERVEKSVNPMGGLGCLFISHFVWRQ